MHFLEFIFTPLRSEEEKAVLIAELLEAGFESFVDEEHSLMGYISSEHYIKDLVDNISFLKDHPEIKFEVKPLEDINWNREWESNYQPVTIAGRCYVRAPFHPSLPGMTYEIVIEPKMAFGTAHHETTQLMAGWLMDLDVRGKEVLDMGCGTGILAILANKMGAGNVTAIDNDEWAWRNGMENFRINDVAAGKVYAGDASLIRPDSFDLILANINRNVLLQDMKAYHSGLRKNGILLLSGFYQQDIESIMASAAENALQFKASRTLNDWTVAIFYK
jgi:ribosomal protein L11 methyltransferase